MASDAGISRARHRRRRVFGALTALSIHRASASGHPLARLGKAATLPLCSGFEPEGTACSGRGTSAHVRARPSTLIGNASDLFSPPITPMGKQALPQTRPSSAPWGITRLLDRRCAALLIAFQHLLHLEDFCRYTRSSATSLLDLPLMQSRPTHRSLNDRRRFGPRSSRFRARVVACMHPSRAGDALGADSRSRSNSARSRVAMLALSALVASLPWANASAECRSPVDIFANPFGKDSAHHRPIGSGAVFADRNHPSTVSLLKNGFNTVNPVTGCLPSHIGRPASHSDICRATRQPRSSRDTSCPTEPHLLGHRRGYLHQRCRPPAITHEFYHWQWVDGKPKAPPIASWTSGVSGIADPGGRAWVRARPAWRSCSA